MPSSAPQKALVELEWKLRMWLEVSSYKKIEKEKKIVRVRAL